MLILTVGIHDPNAAVKILLLMAFETDK